MLFGEVTSSACEGRQASGIRGPRTLGGGEVGGAGATGQCDGRWGGAWGRQRRIFSRLATGCQVCARKGRFWACLSSAGERAMTLSQGQKRGDQRGGLWPGTACSRTQLWGLLDEGVTRTNGSSVRSEMRALSREPFKKVGQDDWEGATEVRRNVPAQSHDPTPSPAMVSTCTCPTRYLRPSSPV